MSIRILATGSRAHPFPDKVFKIVEVFTSYAEAAHIWRDQVVWVNGDCPTKPDDAIRGFESVDKIVQRYCKQYADVHSEEHPANWDNAHMVKLGARYCLAFPDAKTKSGTRNCIKLAENAGIPVLTFELPEFEEKFPVKKLIDFAQKCKVKKDIVKEWKGF